MNLVISVVNPFPPEGVSLDKYIQYIRTQSPIKIKKKDYIFLEDNCINVYRE
jgi:predicted phosphatase